MADEPISIAVSDDGTIDEIVALLQLLGLTGEEATARVAGGFVNMSSSQKVAEAGALAFGAAANAGFTATDKFSTALDKLTTSEQRAATTGAGLVALTRNLATAQNDGYAAAVAAAAGAERQSTAMNAQGEAVQQLTRLQQNLLAREQERNAASAAAASSTDAVTSAVTRQRSVITEASSAYDRWAAATRVVITAEGEAAMELVALTGAAERTVGAFAAVDKALTDSAAAASREAMSFTASADAANARVAAGERLTAETAALSTALAREGAALVEAGAAAVTFEERVAAVGTAGAKVGQTFGGLNAIFAAAFTTDALIKADDTFVKLQASLGLVTSSATELKTVYSQLLTTANSTQSSLEGNVKLYSSLAEATKGSGIAAGDLVKAVGGLDTALKLGNVSGNEAYRVMRTLSEIMTTAGGNSSRFFTTLKSESPVAFGLLQQSAKELGLNLLTLGDDGTKAQEKIDKLAQNVKDLQSKADGTNTSVGTLTSGIKSNADAIADNNAKLLALRTGHAGTKLSADALAASETSLEVSTASHTAAMQKEQAQLRQAKTDLDAKTAGQLKDAKASLASAEATGKNTDAQKQLIAIAEHLYATSGDLAVKFTTVSGALEVLKNNFIDFAGNSTTTNATMLVLKSTILLLAQNLGTVVPLVVAFGAAIAAVKIAGLVKDVLDIGKALVLLAFNPVVIGVAAFTAAVVVAIAAIQGFINLFLPANQQLDTFGTLLTTAQAGASAFGAVVGKLAATITDHAIHTQAANDVTALLNKTNADGTTKVVALTGANNDNSASLFKIVDSATQAQKVQDDYNTKLAAYNAQVAKSAQDNTAYAGSFDGIGKAIDRAVQKLQEFISWAAAAAKSALGLGGSGSGSGSGASAAPAAAAAAAPAARDGGSFHIPGGSGVDSKLIAVSPGEVVTVQTPMQYRQGIRPVHNGAQTHFATGGVTTGAGVDLGTGIGLQLGTPTGGDVTGYNSTSPTTAEVANTTATDSNTAAVTANTTAVTSAANDNTASTTAAGGTSTVADIASAGPGLSIGGPAALSANAASAAIFAMAGMIGTGGSVAAASTSSDAADATKGTAANPLVTTTLQDTTAGDVSKISGATTVDTRGAQYGYQLPGTYNGAARDGADFYVPGGSGVDSRTLNLAVSPGESVHVRTPAQQNASSTPAAGGNVYMTVNAADASSFAASQDQLASKLTRGLRRASRKG